MSGRDKAAGHENPQGVPPYLSYRTFCKFLDELRKKGPPNRIDRSVTTKMSGSTRAHLMATLRYLELILPNGAPTSMLTRLAAADGPERQRILKEMMHS